MSKVGYNERKKKTEEARKTVKLPKPGALFKTSVDICANCKHGSSMSGGSYFTCDYYLNTGKMRGCRQGECDKFDKLLTKKPRKLAPYC